MQNKKRESKLRPQEVLAYIESKGWSYREDDKGENYKVQDCIFCGNGSYNFEIQKDRGFYKTWCCGEGGSFYELRESQGDSKIRISKAVEEEPNFKGKGKEGKVKAVDTSALTESALKFHEKISLRAEAMQYLKGRGFKEETINHFKLGCQKKNDQFWITIPHFIKDQAVNIKYRSMPPEKKWRQEEGSKKILFNQDVLADFDEIIITEGELKTIALHQVGIKNSVSLTGGVQNIQPHWVDALDKMKKIYVCLDSDEAGQKGAEALAMRLGPERCYNIKLEDAKDPDEWLFQRKHTAEEFRELCRRAKRFDVKNIVSISDAFKELEIELLSGDVDASEGLKTPWDSVNRILGGFRPGQLIVLAAPPKVGKTTFALQISIYQASINNPVLFFCLEMNAKAIAKKTIQQFQNTRDEDIDIDDIANTRYQMRRYPIFLPSFVQRGITAEDCFDAIKLAYRRYGLKMVVFDNLHFLVRTADKQREEIGQVSQQFKLLAEELKIPIILIVHPRKLNKNRAMTADDIKESGSIHADADQVIFLHRKRNKVDDMKSDDDDPEADDDEKGFIMEPQTDVICDASRFSKGGKATLFYEGHLSKYLTMEEKNKEGGHL